MKQIEINNAYEGNLKHISVTIPKEKLVVFTGVSGSGKSTLLMDVLFNECQRLYLEAITLQGIRKPSVDKIKGASPAIAINQNAVNTNPRSSVGTLTNVYTDLRMVYEKCGIRECPFCHEAISAADCKEETEKKNQDFHVYMTCHKCGKRMDKLTRSHFSTNTSEGACAICGGLGQIHAVSKERIVNDKISLEEGAIQCWEMQYAKYQLSIFYAASSYYGMNICKGIPICEWDELQKEVLFCGCECEAIRKAFPDKKPPRTSQEGKFEGVIPNLCRRLKETGGTSKSVSTYFDVVECTTCQGEGLNELSRSVLVQDVRLPELSSLSFENLVHWVTEFEHTIPKHQKVLVSDYILDIKTKLQRFIYVGLGYLSLKRQVLTLSGGEHQRLRLAALLDSELSGVIYILDEPTTGLHPSDTKGLINILKKLRDLGNTVLVIEHDVDVIQQADVLIDIGPGSGKLGGEIVFNGKSEAIKKCKSSFTGQYLIQQTCRKNQTRIHQGVIGIVDAQTFNLKKVSVDIPMGCLTSITGPSGSGKSTLIFEELVKKKNGTGLVCFDHIVQIEQTGITRMRRSNVATYADIYTEIRTIFSSHEKAHKLNFSPKHFSFNTSGGRCERCEGMGVIESNLLFFSNNEVVCPECNGKRFSEDVLSIQVNNKSIHEVLVLSIDEAADFFKDHLKISKSLCLLQDVGLGYLELGQSLTTLSGGEAQRLKLAKELIGVRKNKKSLYLMDEPTSGLHPKDVENFLILLDRLIDRGNTVVIVEHNQQIINHSDWVIDLGPAGGDKGGMVMFTGTPSQLVLDVTNSTAKFL